LGLSLDTYVLHHADSRYEMRDARLKNANWQQTL